MTHEATIHPTQTVILRELLFVPSAKFNALQKATGLESDHFKFHLGRLVDVGYIEKTDVGYSLTTFGKEYANKIDTDKNQIERQPKSAVIIVVSNADKQFVVQERLKHPYYGFWGFPGGKIRWGETILEAAARELDEETGLSASLHYQGVYHEHVRSMETNEIIEDKIFHIVSGTHPIGELRESFEGGRSSWLRVEDIRLKDHVYKSFETELRVGVGEAQFIEEVQTYSTAEF